MPANWTTGSGNPSDSIGADGDLYRDFSNRIDWGPKGRISAGSWQGTAQSNIGGTGLGILSSVGVPQSNFGQNGNTAVDAVTGLTYTKANNAWTQQGMLPQGPVGPAGFTTLPNATLVPGPAVNYNATVSATPLVATVPGSTTIPQVYFPQGPQALLGLGYVNFGVAATAELWDNTTGTRIYAVSMAAGSYVSTGIFASNLYPMISGNQHVWRLTGSGAASGQLSPVYLSPSTTNTPCFSLMQGFTTAPGQSFSSTALDVIAFGSGTRPRNVVPIRAASIVGLVGTYTPSAAGAAAASVTITMGTFNPSGGAVTTLFTTTTTIPNTGVPTNLGSYAVGQYVVPAGLVMFMRVQGSGTGQVNCDVQVVS